MLRTILLAFAFVLFAVAAWRPVHPDASSRLVALGLAFGTLAVLLGALR